MISMEMLYKSEDSKNGDMVETRAWTMISKVQEYLLKNLSMGNMIEARPLVRTHDMPDFFLRIVIYPGPTVQIEPQNMRSDILQIMDDYAWPYERIFMTIERPNAVWGIVGGELSRT